MERVPTCRKRLLLLWGHESKLLEGLQSKGDQYIRFVRCVSSDILEIALRCRRDVIFVEVRGIDGKSAHM